MAASTGEEVQPKLEQPVENTEDIQGKPTVQVSTVVDQSHKYGESEV